MTNFKYEEWHLLWKAVEARASFFWAQVERLQVESNNEQPPSHNTDLWVHFLELAEEQTYLLNKIETMANERFPILEPFPNPDETPGTKYLDPEVDEVYPNEDLVDLDKIKLDS